MHFARRLFLVLPVFVVFYFLYYLQFTSEYIFKIHQSARQVSHLNRFEIDEPNAFCARPDLRHAESAARYYMDGEGVKECDILSGKDFVSIRDERNGTEWMYSITVNANAVFERTGLRKQSIICEIQKFDKDFSSTKFYEDYLEFSSVLKATRDNNFTVYVEHGYYDVLCYRKVNGEKGELVYNDQYMILPRVMSKLVEERRAMKVYRKDKLRDPVKFLNMENKLKIERKMNVLHIRIDSISYLHLARTMPHTYKYLTQELQHNIMFTSANSVGENTLPNMVPLFSNVVVEKVESANLESEWDYWNKKDDEYYNPYPFIWYDYESIGYLTALQEDSPMIGPFHYNRRGFRFRPTTVYARPMMLRAHFSKFKTDNETCTHGRAIYKMHFDNLEAFLDRMHNVEENKNTPFFYVMFMAEYTHGDFVVSEEVDLYFRNSLERLDRKGYFNNTLLYVYSDHGFRLGSYSSKTETGQIEKNLPFGCLRLPNQLRGSKFEENTRRNRHRLLTFYDMYQTFRHFLHLNANYSHELDPSQFSVNNNKERLERGMSLFEPIPANRTCADALIPDAYCLCTPRKAIDEAAFYNQEKLKFNTVLDFIVHSVNNITAQKRDMCVSFKKQKLQVVHSFQGQHKYQFIVICSPGSAWFDATVSINEGQMNIHGKIQRVSVYGDTSHCVEDAHLRNFCFCKDKL